MIRLEMCPVKDVTVSVVPLPTTMREADALRFRLLQQNDNNLLVLIADCFSISATFLLLFLIFYFPARHFPRYYKLYTLTAGKLRKVGN